MTIDRNAILHAPGGGTSYWVLGDLYTIKARGEETGNAYALVEIVVQPGGGTPPHIHGHEDEAFYIQSGELEFQLDERVILATPGTFLHSPKGQLHRFTNKNETPAKLLCWVTPAGLEKFFIAVGSPVRSTAEQPPSVRPEDIERVMSEAHKYGLEIVPPPA